MDERTREANNEFECSSDKWRHGHIIFGRFGSTLGLENIRMQAKTQYKRQKEH